MSDNGSDDDQRTQRRLRVGAVAAAAVALLFIYAASRGDGDDASASVTLGGGRAGSSSADGMSSRPQAMPTSSSSAAVDPPDEARPGELEVCGVGRFPADRVVELGEAHAAQAEAAVAGFIASLRSDGDERRHVAGLFLQRAADMEAAASADLQAATQRCGADAACLEDAGQSRFDVMTHTTEAASEEIARLAMASHDPFTYAVAMQACGPIGVTPVAAPSCRLLSAEQWARVDPGNAVPWLHVAAAAKARKDTAALDEAIYRVSTATSNTLHGYSLYGYAASHLPAGASAFEQAQLFMFVTGAVAGQVPPYQTVAQYCAASALHDSNRWQACDALARNFVERPSTLIERRIGERIGERARWPPEKIAARREEDDAMGQAQAELLPALQPLGCRAVKGRRDYLLQVSRLGEFGAARATMVASGRSVATLAAQARAERDAVALAAAAEAALQPASTPYSAAPPPAR